MIITVPTGGATYYIGVTVWFSGGTFGVVVSCTCVLESNLTKQTNASIFQASPFVVGGLVSNVQQIFNLSSAQPYKFFSYSAPAGPLEITAFGAQNFYFIGSLFVSTTNKYPRSASSCNFSSSDSGKSTVIIIVPTVGATYYIGVASYGSGTFGIVVICV